MSSERQVIKNSIWRLMAASPRFDEIERRLDAVQNRGDQAGSSASASPDGEGRICCDGSTADGVPGVTQRDPDSGGQSGLDPNDPAKLTMGEGSLTGLTDCDTAESVCMDGDEWALPENWDDLDSPPLIESYEAGRYWYGSSIPGGDGSGSFPSPTAEGSYQQFVDFQEGEGIDPSNYELRQDSQYLYHAHYLPSDSVALYFVSTECNGSSAGYCNPDPEDIQASSWPSDGCVNLAVKGGKIVGSNQDPDNPGTYNAPLSSINLCDSVSGKSILYQPLPGGGFRTIESSGGVAVSGVVGYTYSADGTQTGTITQAEWDATAP